MHCLLFLDIIKFSFNRRTMWPTLTHKGAAESFIENKARGSSIIIQFIHNQFNKISQIFLKKKKRMTQGIFAGNWSSSTFDCISMLSHCCWYYKRLVLHTLWPFLWLEHTRIWGGLYWVFHAISSIIFFERDAAAAAPPPSLTVIDILLTLEMLRSIKN